MDEAINKIVTDYFDLIPVEKSNEQDGVFHWYNGAQLWANMLVSEGAYKIIIPFVNEPVMGEMIMEDIEKLPLYIRKKIDIVDNNGKIREKVNCYFEPIWRSCNLTNAMAFLNYDDNEYKHLKTKLPPYLGHNMLMFGVPLFRFIYKLALAAEYGAEVDVEGFSMIPDLCDLFIENVSDDSEALFRLSEIKGLHGLYLKNSLDTLYILPVSNSKDIYDRLFDMFAESELINISEERKTLGKIGYKSAKSVILRIKQKVHNFFNSSSYSKHLRLGEQSIHLIGDIAGVGSATKGIGIIKDMYSKNFNPPIVNLDSLRAELCENNKCRLKTQTFA